MNITYAARVTPDIPCTVFFEEDEWKVVYCAANKTKKPPGKARAILEAATFPGLLGGPKRVPGDSPAGVKTAWIGIDKLNTLLAYREWLV